MKKVRQGSKTLTLAIVLALFSLLGSISQSFAQATSPEYFKAQDAKGKEIQCAKFSNGSVESGVIKKNKFVSDNLAIASLTKRIAKASDELKPRLQKQVDTYKAKINACKKIDEINTKAKQPALFKTKDAKGKNIQCAKLSNGSIQSGSVKKRVFISDKTKVSDLNRQIAKAKGSKKSKLKKDLNSFKAAMKTRTSLCKKAGKIKFPAPTPAPLSPVSDSLSPAGLAVLYEKAALGAVPNDANLKKVTSLNAAISYMLADHTTDAEKTTRDVLADLNILILRDWLNLPSNVRNYSGSIEPNALSQACQHKGSAPSKPEDLSVTEYKTLLSNAFDNNEPSYIFKLMFELYWNLEDGQAVSGVAFSWDAPAKACRTEYLLSRQASYLKSQYANWTKYSRLESILNQWKQSGARVSSPFPNVCKATCYSQISRSAASFFRYLEMLYTIAREDIVEFEALDWRDRAIGNNYFDNQRPWHDRWGLRLLIRTQNPFQERLAWNFLHNYFALSYAKDGIGGVTDSHFYSYIQRLRDFSYSSDMDFRQLLKDITRSPAMLSWLDNGKNTKSLPNENFARELLELFTLGPKNSAGEDNYDLQDIISVARALSGLRGGTHSNPLVDGDFYHPVQPAHLVTSGIDWPTTRYYHSLFSGIPWIGRQYSSTHFRGPHVLFAGKPWETEVENYEEAIDAILDRHPAASRYLARRIVEEYISEQPAAELVEAVAQSIIKNQFKLRPVFEELFKSYAFYSPAYKNSVTKNPTERIVELVRRLEIPVVFNELVDDMTKTGHELGNPPNVFGWDAEMWSNSAWATQVQNIYGHILSFHGIDAWGSADFSSKYDVRGWNMAPTDVFAKHTLRNLGVVSASSELTQRFANSLTENSGIRSDLPWWQLMYGNMPEAEGIRSKRLQLAIRQVYDYRSLYTSTPSNAEELIEVLAVKMGVELNAAQKSAISQFATAQGGWRPNNADASNELIRGIINLIVSTNDFALR